MDLEALPSQPLPALRVHDVLHLSCANGPGARAVIWVQGCTLACAGCFNPATHAPDGGRSMSVAALAEWILARPRQAWPRASGGDLAIEGVSISGGEPFQQPVPLLALLRHVRQCSDLSLLIFSGYSLAEIQAMRHGRELLDQIDVLVAGRYDAARPVRDGLRSSANQMVHRLTDRYTVEELAAVPPAEAIITPAGDVILSGVAGLHF